MGLTIFCDINFPLEAERELRAGLAEHELTFTSNPLQSNLSAATLDPALLDADVAFGQPPVEGLLASSRLRWAHLTSAGYARYDTDAVRQSLQAKNIALTTSSTADSNEVNHCSIE